MLKFAIVGNIASGKSTVEKYLENYGFKVFDTDKICHEILINSKSDLINIFKNFDILDNNELSRKKIGNIVFNNYELKIKLENVIYPKLKNNIKKIFEDNSNEKFIFISIPLLFEVGWQNLFDKILFIQTDDNIRLERLIKRNSFTIEEAKSRINSQLSQEEKLKQSDFIICNNDNLILLQKQIDRFIIQLEDME